MSPLLSEVRPEVSRRIEDDAVLTMLVWRFARPVLTASSAPLGGGLGLRQWVVNAQVPFTYARSDPEAHLEGLARHIGLEGAGVGMMTAVDLRRATSAVDGGARADASVGLTFPTWAAAPDEGSFVLGAAAPSGSAGWRRSDEWPRSDPSGGPARTSGSAGSRASTTSSGAGGAPGPGGYGGAPGTVNVVGIVPERLSPAALVNAVLTVTEAKVQALWDAGVAATGTASDAVCIVCPGEGPAHPFGGPRSEWGARLARAVHRAVLEACTSGAAS